MAKKSIPNNPVVLLQGNAQVLRTILSEGGLHTPVTALLLLQKNNDEAIRVMQTHGKSDAFTIVPKEVVFLCRQTLTMNVGILKKGIQEHKDNQEFINRAKAKIDTYRSILNRLPTSELPPAPKPPGLRSDVKLDAKVSMEVERKKKPDTSGA